MPQTDDSEGPSTLPRPELNPLVNSLLGQNLGRWAEVYFTSPPETREQAVLDLLRELEAQQSTPGPDAVRVAPQIAEIADVRSDRSPLDRSPLPSRSTEAEAPLPSRAMNPQTWSTENLPRDRSNELGRRSTRDLFSTLANAPRQNYLLAASLSALLAAVVLAYFMWPGARRNTTVTNPSLDQSAQPNTQASDHSRQPNVLSEAATSPAADEAAKLKASRKLPGASGHAGSGLATMASHTGPTPIGASPDHGFGELALAKGYLNSSGSQKRDPAEAARLLWKAVAKQNVEASEILANLYLKGDGIAKNCDQARLLLDAAARKGDKEAAEQLGQLQTFGCQ